MVDRDVAQRRSVDFLALGLIYSLVYGSLLLATNFLPYVFDNNESFSAFIHGENLFKFGLESSSLDFA
jgi:hypothetical protein